MRYLKRTDEIKVCGAYDVVVIGGGVAGVAAAIASARRGARTLLIEKSVMLGGLATLGYITIYLPLCDGCGRRLIGGISEELLWLSIRNSYDNLPSKWRSRPAYAESEGGRYRTSFNGHAFAMQLDQTVLDSGAEILFDTLFTGAETENGRITHVILENKDGRTAYAAQTVIDATGDAMVAHMVGAPTVNGRNYLCYWGYYTDTASVAKAAADADVSECVKMYMWGDCRGTTQPADMPPTAGVTAAEVNDFLLRGRRAALERLRSENPKGFAFTGFPAMPQFRTSRMTRGDYALSYADSGKYFADSIGCCGDWRKAGVSFELPYRALTIPGYPNLLSVGRNSSNADSEAWEVTRVIPAAALTGEAAGVAASLQANDVHDADVSSIQRVMAAGGTVLHLADAQNGNRG